MTGRKMHLLGAGLYGCVYLATLGNNSDTSDSVVAVKSGNTEHSISSLQVEANLLQELRGYPYIIRGLGNDISLEDGRMVYNLLLEYARFGSLDKIIKKFGGKMYEAVVACYAYMLLKGLAILHDKGIVHCDIKPANILVFPAPGWNGIGLLKIADFGLSKNVWDWERRPRGTPLYAPPEVVNYGLQEKAGDIWALGCIVTEMMTGRRLWSYTAESQDLFGQIAYESPWIPERISEDGKDFLKRCLDKNHNLRWTAKMLLNHPFINRVKSSMFGAYLHRQEVVFPTKPWICSKNMFSITLKAQLINNERFPGDKKQVFRNPLRLPHEMFSTTLKAQSVKVYESNELFPGDKKQGYGNPLPLPHGAELIPN